MALHLYFHPFSSYCQKALVALYENAVPFEPHPLDGPDTRPSRELAELWPMKRFPVLVDGDRRSSKRPASSNTSACTGPAPCS